MEIQTPDKQDQEEVKGDIFVSQITKKGGITGNIGKQFVGITPVMFRPGERTNWHTHDYGQTLVVTEGTGICATENEEVEVSEGDIIFFPPDEVHWHGSSPEIDKRFEHVSIVVRDEPSGGTHAVRELNLE